MEIFSNKTKKIITIIAIFFIFFMILSIIVPQYVKASSGLQLSEIKVGSRIQLLGGNITEYKTVIAAKNKDKKKIKSTIKKGNVIQISSKNSIYKYVLKTSSGGFINYNEAISSKRYFVKEEVKVTGIKLNATSITLNVNESITLTGNITPSNATNKTVTWSTSKSSVATVSKTGIITTKAEGTATITAKSNNGKTATCKITVTKDKLQLDKITNGSKIKLVGGNLTEYKTVTAAKNKDTKKINSTISSGKLIQIISKDSKYKYVLKTSSGGYINYNEAISSGRYFVKEVEAIGIKLKTTSINLIVNESKTLTGEITPSNATNKTVTWSTSNGSVATVSKTGMIIAKAEGTATITATTNNGKKATCVVKVSKGNTPVAVESISLNKTSIELKVKRAIILTGKITPSNATDKNVTWSTSNGSVATVSKTGMIIAKKEGTAIITATTNNGKKATCKITVTNSNTEVTRVRLNKRSITISKSETTTIKTTVLPSNATDKNITWSTSNRSVATVDSKGKVTGISEGTATITATANNGKKATCTISVKAEQASGGSSGSNTNLNEKVNLSDIVVRQRLKIIGGSIVSYNKDGSEMETIPDNWTIKISSIVGDKLYLTRGGYIQYNKLPNSVYLTKVKAELADIRIGDTLKIIGGAIIGYNENGSREGKIPEKYTIMITKIDGNKLYVSRGGYIKYNELTNSVYLVMEKSCGGIEGGYSKDDRIIGTFKSNITGKTFYVYNQNKIANTHGDDWYGYCNRATSMTIASAYTNSSTNVDYMINKVSKYAGNVYPVKHAYFTEEHGITIGTGKTRTNYVNELRSKLIYGYTAAIRIDKKNYYGKSGKKWTTNGHWVSILGYRNWNNGEEIYVGDPGHGNTGWVRIDEFTKKGGQEIQYLYYFK